MTDPRIEPAARAIYADVNKGHSRDKGWDEVLPRWQEDYRSNARAALAAADNAATITTVEGLDALPAGSWIMLHCDLLLRIAEVVDESNWIDLGNACPVDNDSLRMALDNLGPAQVVRWGQA